MRNRNEPKAGGAETDVGAALPEDETLIRRFLDVGDKKAFEQLIHRHLPSIRRMLYTLFNGQREDMEDAEQEIILSLYRGLRDFRFHSSFRTYLYRLARNRGIDCLRRKVSRKRMRSRLRLQLQNQEPVDPEQQALRRIQADTVLRAVQTLPLIDRQLIVMKDVDGFSLEQIAEIMEAPLGTIKSRLHRARNRLVNRLRGGL